MRDGGGRGKEKPAESWESIWEMIRGDNDVGIVERRNDLAAGFPSL